ncbi:MAG: glycosyltransferase family 4 protein [Candidatus Hodarchaeota archaeon]
MGGKKSSSKAVLIVGPIPPPYHGVSIITETIITSDLREHFDLHLLDITDRREISNVGHPDLKDIGLFIKQFLNLVRLILLKKPRIVYLTLSQTLIGYTRDVLFFIPAIVLSKKIILHLQGGSFRNFYENSNFLIRKLIKYTLKGVARILILSKRFESIFDGIFPKKNLRIVPDGIKVPEFESINKYKDSKTPRVLYTGTLMEEKGFLCIIKAIPIVIGQRDAEFIFIGDWYRDKDRNKALNLIRRFGIARYVNFLGTVDGETKQRWFLSSDIFVFVPLHEEGQPLTILEAMGYSLPIISTNSGCIEDMVVDSENGFIVKRGDHQAVAEKLLILLSNDELRTKMGELGKRRFFDRFTAERFIHNLGQAFQEVLRV